MRKKTLSLALAIAFGVSLLAGCGTVPVKEETATQEQTEEISQEETQTEEETESDTDTGEENIPEVDTDASAADITPVEATLENPAQLGEWVETKTYSAEDQQEHTIYVRITDVLRGEEAKKIVDVYNAEDHAVVISELDKDDLEYCIILYETYFPADFPQADYGITNVEAEMEVCNLEGAGAIADYIGLSSVWDITEHPEVDEFFAGNTFKDGKAVFAMVKGHTEYLINVSYFGEDDAYVRGK